MRVDDEDASGKLGRRTAPDTGYIHSVETFGTVDGPGIRYIVFTQGCLMRCLYCHNRDTWDRRGGKVMKVAELMEDIRKYVPFMKSSGGGVTVTGGEPLLQKVFLRHLFEACQAEGIHTCLDTNGFLGPSGYDDDLEGLLDHTDLVLLDLKQIDDEMHKELTAVSNSWPLRFARHLEKRAIPTWIRYVVVGGYTEDPKWAAGLADFIKDMKNVEKVELLPYHKLGKHKWDAFSDQYPLQDLEPPTTSTLEAVKAEFTKQGLSADYNN